MSWPRGGPTDRPVAQKASDKDRPPGGSWLLTGDIGLTSLTGARLP
jgi:hypothetical protein